ncbi:hypothetical protein SAMN05443252_104135 [Bacillus sp. OV322]|uniref:hypothetical protein n=1 Tax=Bacillus sp. OV322 TaxID=1882764 RepID=UPI0008F04890|nr:hypothetical protein [Bacillus sp. OV322]SFC52977.1 hypothetical protein SAMN05443252_104135 [Bacillus sp. OV322]
MPLFSQKKNGEDTPDFETQIRRINTLEVHVDRLLKLENKVSPLLIGKKYAEKKTETGSTAGAGDRSLQDINKRLHRLEQSPREWASKLNAIEQRVKMEQASRNYDEYLNEMDERIFAMEEKMIQLHGTQLDILSRLDEMSAELSQYKGQGPTKDKQQVIVKEINIEKFYLDKYEQNNNFAQLGIKELSGALNIGATYGTGVFPEALTQQMKDDMAELQAAKDDLPDKQVTPEETEMKVEEEFYSEVSIDDESS